ncbi:MAG: hypothetical protein ACK4M1_06220 [Flavobacterium sp.]
MKKIYTILLLISFQILIAQELDQEKLKFNPKISIGFITESFFGDNYLSKGHKNPSIGAELDFQMISYSNFNLGFGFKKTTLSVEDKAIGGNIDKSNMNSINGFISYDAFKYNKFQFIPSLSYGAIEIRQKDGSKLYGVQNGNYFEVSIKTNYVLKNKINLYSKIGIAKHFLNVNTTNEFKSYFNHSNSINLSLGIQFL